MVENQVVAISEFDPTTATPASGSNTALSTEPQMFQAVVACS